MSGLSVEWRPPCDYMVFISGFLITRKGKTCGSTVCDRRNKGREVLVVEGRGGSVEK